MPETLTNIALTRLRTLAQGNEMAPESIEVIEQQEATYTVNGILQLTPRSSIRSRDSLGPLNTKGAKKLSSFTLLQQELDRIKQEETNDGAWLTQAIKELEKTPGHGWGHQDSHLAWSDKETILTATENCPKCRGAAQFPCPTCQGIGTQQCHYCEGRGQEYCPQCAGRGTDTNNPQNPCPFCQGTGHILCRYCNGQRRLPCGTCHAKSHIPCDRCKGTGVQSREVRIRSGADMAFHMESTTSLPSGLLRAVSRVGEENLHKGHADITLIPPEEDKNGKRKDTTIRLEAKIPYADLKIRFNGKGAIVSCFGKKARLTGIPPFLDEALSSARANLAKAARSAFPLEQALGPRLMQEALTLTLSGQSHPNKLRGRYPVGLTEKTAQEIMGHMVQALKRETMKVRTVIAVFCTLLSVGGFVALFVSSMYSWMLKNMKANLVLGLEVAIPLFALGFTWVALHSFSQSHLKRRFPGVKITGSPNLGVRGYTALITIVTAYILLLTYAKMTFVY